MRPRAGSRVGTARTDRIEPLTAPVDDLPVEDPPVDDPLQEPTGPARPGMSPWWYRTILPLWAVLLQVVLYSNSGYSWHFFADGATLLLGGHPPGMDLPGGLHLYANYPQLQFGPVALLAAVLLRPVISTGGWMIATWLMTLGGLAVLRLLEQIARGLRRGHDWDSPETVATMLLGGGSFLLSWELLAVHFGHLDDVLALVLLASAAGAVAYRDPILAGGCLGLAVDAKPWALACIALLLALPGQDRWRALAVAAAVVAAAWLPFVLADPHTLQAAGTFTIPNVPASGLHALGVNTPNTPTWDRIAQIGVGCLLGAIALLRGRWETVLALGIGARIVLDPSVYTYYTAGLALGLLLWDLIGYRRPLPVLSVLCFGGLTVAAVLVKNPHLVGELRVWTVLLAAVLMLAAPTSRASTADDFLDRPAENHPTG